MMTTTRTTTIQDNLCIQFALQLGYQRFHCAESNEEEGEGY